MSGNSVNCSNPYDPDSLPRYVDWLLTDIEWIVTCDGTMSCIERGALAIDGEMLVALGPSEPIAAAYRGRRTLNLSNHLVLPGLVNSHTHGAMSCLRGLGNDLPLQRWLHDIIFPTEAQHVNPDFVYWGTLLAIVEMLRNGVTTFCDGYFFEESAVQAASKAGIRAVLGQGILDFPAPDQPNLQAARRRAETFLDSFPKEQERLRPSLFCHAPYTCGTQTLQWVKELCRQHALIFQLHLSETAAEVKELTRRHHVGPVKYLDRLGVLDSNTLCAHAVWLQPDEIEILAERGVGISHNAESNMKLACGVAPLPALLTAGVRVGLGTDSCASNNDLDLLSEMDKVAKLHKVYQLDPVICSASQVLKMATAGGAAVLGWDDQIGSLQVGKKADLVAVDLLQPHLTPLYDPISQLVYTAQGSDVRHVWVDGRKVVTDGQVVVLDEAEVMEQVNRIAKDIAHGLR
ncbi:amidohydrolase family protein [Desulfoferrobacter suflitae]|uniref:amidohydrolase family protein n=1 Tax=Desulfoferrobacter suflitae TaxID=2865782 RepID=UPI0021644D28|nr:amidohydrolase [Desulfoferrobacter suflitae]MCK8600559.1 amidohydrolase [Desulfoferrobacter suflitae]